jgi:hypothetical protein
MGEQEQEPGGLVPPYDGRQGVSDERDSTSVDPDD